MARKQTATGTKLAYKPSEAAELTPFGYETLLGFINAGELKASRRQDSDGKPVGPFIILHADLEDFLAKIPAA